MVRAGPGLVAAPAGQPARGALIGFVARRVILATTAGVLLVVVPALGAALAALVEPPPAQPADFSWSWFTAIAGAELAVLLPFIWRLLRHRPRRAAVVARRLPWWGWLSLLWLGGWWLLAWQRFGWLGPLQGHTFLPLWLGYIGLVNAWTWRRGGRCLLTHHPWLLAALFPLSALFWWSFEYLNRYTGNWHYAGVQHSGAGYALAASLAFSTVLPAVLSTRDWLASYPALRAGLGELWVWPGAAGRPAAQAAVVLALVGLLLLPLWPQLLYPLVWVAPGLLLLGLAGLAGESMPLSALARGDWRGLWLAALAGLVCGFFWELWNWGSLARWEYHVPRVGRFKVFAMPLLGYGGYLPFGVTCVAAATLLLGPRPALLWGMAIPAPGADGDKGVGGEVSRGEEPHAAAQRDRATR